MESKLNMEILLRLKCSRNKIICNIVRARNLLQLENVDKIYSPCVKIQVIKTLSEQTKYKRSFILSPRTRNIQGSVDPEWNEQLQIIFNKKNYQKLSLLIQCWNSDTFESNDFIGYNILAIASFIDNSMDDWLPLLPDQNLVDKFEQENFNLLDQYRSISCIPCLRVDEIDQENSEQHHNHDNEVLPAEKKSLLPIPMRKRAKSDQTPILFRQNILSCLSNRKKDKTEEERRSINDQEYTIQNSFNQNELPKKIEHVSFPSLLPELGQGHHDLFGSQKIDNEDTKTRRRKRDYIKSFLQNNIMISK